MFHIKTSELPKPKRVVIPSTCLSGAYSMPGKNKLFVVVAIRNPSTPASPSVQICGVQFSLQLPKMPETWP